MQTIPEKLNLTNKSRVTYLLELLNYNKSEKNAISTKFY